jgi:hypothetical protein
MYMLVKNGACAGKPSGDRDCDIIISYVYVHIYIYIRKYIYITYRAHVYERMDI